MSNIRLSVLSFNKNPALLRVYQSYIETADETSRVRLQQKLERVIGRSLYGAKKIPGDPRLEPDWIIDQSKAALEITNKFGIFESDADSGVLRIEAKLKRRKEEKRTKTDIGSGVLSNSIINEILQNRQEIPVNNIERTVFTKIIKDYVNKSGSDLFNFLATNAPTTIHEPAYNKSKNLTIFSKTSGSLLAYQIYFPRAKFKTPIFGSSISSKGVINYFLQTSFEKQLVGAASKAMMVINADIVREQQNLAKTIKSTDISFSNPAKGSKVRPTETLDLIYYSRNSIPMSRGIPKASVNLRLPADIEDKDFDTPRDSVIDITRAVQGKVRSRMRRGVGKPRPPKLYERTGTFRGSIRAHFVERQNTVDYSYIPYYDRLERSGYQVNRLVEDSIRSVVQAKFKQQATTRRINL
jgi:hypothetical protein